MFQFLFLYINDTIRYICDTLCRHCLMPIYVTLAYVITIKLDTETSSIIKKTANTIMFSFEVEQELQQQQKQIKEKH